MSKILMISQPMGGLSEEEILRKRDQIAEEYEKKGYEVMDTYFDSDSEMKMGIEPKFSGVYYLGLSIIAMSYADAVLFCEGFEKARGCRMEHSIAKEYGLEILYEKEERR